YGLEGCSAHDMPVILHPAPDNGIEQQDQFSSRRGWIGLDDCPNLLQKSTDTLLRRLYQELAVVLAYVLAQKIKPVLNLRDAGLLFREFQSTRSQTLLHERQNFLFQ